MPAIAIVPAAGRASRFGGGKLTADIDGEPLLNHTLRSLLHGGVDRVIVVTAPDAAALDGVALIDDARVTRVVNPDPERGMFSSIRTGVAAAAAGDLLLVLPADMPFVKAETVRNIVAASGAAAAIVAPAFDGKHGHPVALPFTLRDEILNEPATSTLATVLERHPREWIDVGDRGVVRDVDTRGDLNQR